MSLPPPPAPPQQITTQAIDESWLEVWRIDTGKPIQCVERGFGYIPHAPFALNHDGTRLVLSVGQSTAPSSGGNRSSDGVQEATMVEEWDLITGQHLYTHRLGVSYQIWEIGYSSDGSTIHFRARGAESQYQVKPGRYGYIIVWNPTFPSASTGTPQVHESVGQDAQLSLSTIRQAHGHALAEVDLAEDMKWVRFKNRYIMPLAAEFRPTLSKKYNTAKSGSKHMIAIQNMENNVINFTIDEETLGNCPRP
ncbi:uncharacterized protein DSM5745_07581 [Aspergillus mulundensis]|uniref:Uncharacterized protein n=1 Tax=Aspergillus mulundensis TaxID=1810919 RepID=A0A3D8REE1_9EURO|nr:hypothetical protein DSM5745_07581 [Aspergillus mulundensis]RDW72409.1 hypothetical protein DSM5745_07581 [Aspergillus mulundensis]